MFEDVNPKHWDFESSGERRTCLMVAQPNRYSTLVWHKSSASGGGGECVEVAQENSSVLVRDSRDQSGALLNFTQAEWRRFVRRVKGAAEAGHSPGP